MTPALRFAPASGSQNFRLDSNCLKGNDQLNAFYGRTSQVTRFARDVTSHESYRGLLAGSGIASWAVGQSLLDSMSLSYLAPNPAERAERKEGG